MPRLGKPSRHWAIIADYGSEMGWYLMGILNWQRLPLCLGQDMRTALFETRREARLAMAAVGWPKRRRVVKVDVWVILAEKGGA